MERPRFVIEAKEAESMAQEAGLTVPQLLPTLVKSAQGLARPPISKFHVGAVGLSSDGRIFIGANLEFPGIPLHHSVHAEQFLVTNAAVHGGRCLTHLAVSDAPCGHCRQFLQELRNAQEIQILITSSQKDPIFKPLSSKLPDPFGPNDLLDEGTPLLLEIQDNGLGFLGNLKNGFVENLENNDSLLKTAALEAANRSHAPYSGCPSGVALMDVDGKVYKGSYMESAAYNPSMGPVQAALVAYLASGGGGYGGIVAAVLVEKEGVMVRQEDTARLMLKAVSPKCELRVFHCSSGSNGCIKAET